VIPKLITLALVGIVQILSVLPGTELPSLAWKNDPFDGGADEAGGSLGSSLAAIAAAPLRPLGRLDATGSVLAEPAQDVRAGRLLPPECRGPPPPPARPSA
jgi:hypothetical protein